jgi:hypothetical protein
MCDMIANAFPDSPYPIKCPINRWAIMMVLRAMQLRLQDQDIITDTSNTTSTDGSGGGDKGLDMAFHVPWYIVKGWFNAQLELKTEKGEVITCASTTLHVV